MTLRVVADNVTELPVGNIPAELRNLADVIEAGYYGNASSAILLLDGDENTVMEIVGKGMSRFEAAGMLQFAIQRLVFDD